MNNDFLRKAEALKPILRHAAVEGAPMGDPCLARAGASVVFDFGNHQVGYLRLELSSQGFHFDAPVYLRVRPCENLRELNETVDGYQGFVSAAWFQEERIHVDVLPARVELERRYAFRYVKVELLAASPRFQPVVRRAWADCITAVNDANAPALAGRDGLERAMDRVALRTLRNCMQDVFEDGPKRDRRLWMGDLRLQAMANARTYRRFDLVKRCLYLFAGTVNEEGRVAACVFTEPEVERDEQFMFDYSLFFASALADYAENTGDKAFARELLPVAWRQVELASREFAGDVKTDCDRLGWCFVDWNLNLNKQTSAHGIYLYCVERLRALCILLGEAEKAAWLQREWEAKAKGALSAFWDEARGVFVSGAEKQCSWASQVWMILGGAKRGAEAARLLARVAEMPDALGMVTPYMMHHYVEALLLAESSEQAREVLRRYWGGMVEHGADTFWELYDPGDPQASPYGNSAVNSYCHAWSCTPSYFLRGDF